MPQDGLCIASSSLAMAPCLVTAAPQAIAHLTGSCFFDLSPRNTDGTYPGKAVAMLVHLVFKVRHPCARSDLIWSYLASF